MRRQYSGSHDAAAPPTLLSPADVLKVVLRSLLVQGTWNPERMLHHGLLFALLPGFRRLTDGAEEHRDLIRRHLALRP